MKNTGRFLFLIPTGIIMSIPLIPSENLAINPLPIGILGAALLLSAFLARVSKNKP
jgi:hypothetical protein